MKTVKDKQKLNYAIITKWFESILSLNSASKWKDVEIVEIKNSHVLTDFWKLSITGAENP